eukprot:2463564-Rhodomonas_salina.1
MRDEGVEGRRDGERRRRRDGETKGTRGGGVGPLETGAAGQDHTTLASRFNDVLRKGNPTSGQREMERLHVTEAQIHVAYDSGTVGSQAPRADGAARLLCAAPLASPASPRHT